MSNLTDPPVEYPDHKDREPDDLIKYVYCSVCLHIKPYDGWKSKCKGAPRIRPRMHPHAEEPPKKTLELLPLTMA